MGSTQLDGVAPQNLCDAKPIGNGCGEPWPEPNAPDSYPASAQTPSASSHAPRTRSLRAAPVTSPFVLWAVTLSSDGLPSANRFASFESASATAWTGSDPLN